jgi:hypothetical protein
MSTEPQYYDLVASLPEDTQSERKQWLHHACGGNLQIGGNASIRCDNAVLNILPCLGL